MTWLRESSTKTKVFLAIGLYFLIGIVVYLIFGSDGKNEDFQPQNEFLLEHWIEIHIAGHRPLDQQGRRSTSSSPRR